ncbi:acyl-CoA thioesterase [Egibacter rhizosphaerae]|uniref:Acyl-CoA thioesterase n=2 Tax=Egibacter rhizosphaerae TaxID=1670831 RepID=A0A411YLM7_9ACTN|nr:acyl-CoA thioesterase [Egibacter rhizosphaerae]
MVHPVRERASGTGVVVMAGSSGRVDVERARLFAHHGAVSLAVGYFGGPGEPPGLCEVPLELFTAAVTGVVSCVSGAVGMVGVSKGAEAALVTACLDSRVDMVTAFAPSSMVWANLGAGRDGRSSPQRSSWTWRDTPLPFVPILTDRAPTVGGLPAYRSVYEASLAAFPQAAKRAAIAVEEVDAALLLVAGGEDAVWPSARFADELERRGSHRVTKLMHTDAGHRIPLPGEPLPAGGQAMARGGNPTADAELGEVAWQHIVTSLQLTP